MCQSVWSETGTAFGLWGSLAKSSLYRSRDTTIRIFSNSHLLTSRLPKRELIQVATKKSRLCSMWKELMVWQCLRHNYSNITPGSIVSLRLICRKMIKFLQPCVLEKSILQNFIFLIFSLISLWFPYSYFFQENKSVILHLNACRIKKCKRKTQRETGSWEGEVKVIPSLSTEK